SITAARSVQRTPSPCSGRVAQTPSPGFASTASVVLSTANVAALTWVGANRATTSIASAVMMAPATTRCMLPQRVHHGVGSEDCVSYPGREDTPGGACTQGGLAA